MPRATPSSSAVTAELCRLSFTIGQISTLSPVLPVRLLMYTLATTIAVTSAGMSMKGYRAAVQAS